MSWTIRAAAVDGAASSDHPVRAGAGSPSPGELLRGEEDRLTAAVNRTALKPPDR